MLIIERTNSPIEPEITLSRALAKRLLEMYDGIEAADAHYQTCQAELFREYARSAYRAKNIANAFDALRARLKEEE